MAHFGLFVLFLCLLSMVSAQRPSSSHRSDVYIAGFFPYGDGVENAATGSVHIRYLIVIPGVYLFQFIFIRERSDA